VIGGVGAVAAAGLDKGSEQVHDDEIGEDLVDCVVEDSDSDGEAEQLDTMKRVGGGMNSKIAEMMMKKDSKRSKGSSSSDSDSDDSSNDSEGEALMDIEDDDMFTNVVDQDGNLEEERKVIVRDKRDVLAQVPFFAQFPQHHQAQLFEELHVEHFKDGDLIVKQGDMGDRMYVIIEGEAVVWREEASGETRDVTHLYQFDYFGELALVYGQVRNSNVSAIGNATVMYLSKEGFEKFENIRVFMIVQKIPLLTKLRLDMQIKIVRKLKAVIFEKGEYVVRQGETGDAFYMISKGSAEVVEHDEVATHLYEGHTFGQMALLSGAPRLASVRASEQLICMELKADAFKELIEQESDFNKLLTSDDRVIRRRRSKRDARKNKSRTGTELGLGFESGRRLSTGSSVSCASNSSAMRNSSFTGSLFGKERGISTLSANGDSVLIENTKVAKTSKGGRRVINGFVIGKDIGKGTFGRVRLCTHEDTGGQYAIKIIDKSKIDMRTVKSKHTPGMDEMRQEVAIMKRLSHPNIVNLCAVIDDPAASQLYIVTEYCEKGAVMEGLDGNDPLPEAKAREYFRDILLGVHYLHGQGVIHRDIKPMNLLLTKDDVVKIGDFGTAARLITGNSKYVAGVTGTPAFMAPELLVEDSEEYDGPAVDLWSCGATLFMLVTGRPPWMSDDEINLAKKVKNDELVFPADWNKNNYSPHLKNLISQLLVKDPKNRLTLQETMKHDWVTEEGSELLEEHQKVLVSWESSGGVEPPSKEEEDAAIDQIQATHSGHTLLSTPANSDASIVGRPTSQLGSSPSGRQRDEKKFDEDLAGMGAKFVEEEEDDDGSESDENAVDLDDYGRFPETPRGNPVPVALKTIGERVVAKKGGKKVGNHLRYAHSEDQNKRARMEDMIAIQTKLSKHKGGLFSHTSASSQYFYAAIYDGHGGDLVSKLLRDELHKVIASQPDFPKDINNAVKVGCLSMDRKMLQKAASIINEQKLKVTAGTARQGLIRTKGDRSSGGSDIHREYQKAGATALICIIQPVDLTLTVAWLGDSRAVLCRTCEGSDEVSAIPLTVDHKASREDEKERIRAAGGSVDRKGRVDGALAVSRAFGDIMHKGPEVKALLDMTEETYVDVLSNGIVIAKPDTISRKLEPTMDEFIILASDGIWDVVTNQKAVNLIRRELNEHQDVQRAADKLVQVAALDSVDNISVVVIALNA